jgi:hypothetical protein
MSGSRFTSALLLALVLSAHAEQPMPDVCSQPPPPGTGLRADGRGIIHIHKAGFYEFYGAKVNLANGPTWFNEGAWASVLSVSSSRIEWRKPDGTREAIPTVVMYPPL